LPLGCVLGAPTQNLASEDKLAIFKSSRYARGVWRFCHRKPIVHRAAIRQRAGAGAVAPAETTGPIEVRLNNIQLAAGEETLRLPPHIESLPPSTWRRRFSTTRLRQTRPSDVFSLGAIAYQVLTGQPRGTLWPLAPRCLLQDGYRAAARDALAAASRVGRSKIRRRRSPRGDDSTTRLRSLDEVVGFDYQSTDTRADSGHRLA
jgi:hypothetical protein